MESNSRVAQETPLDRHGLERMASSDRHHPRKSDSSRIVPETPSKLHEANQEGPTPPSDRHRSQKPISKIVQEMPSERHEVIQEGMLLSSSGPHPLQHSVAQETSSELYKADQEAVFSPSRSPRPSAKALGKQRAASPVLDMRFGLDLLPSTPQFTAHHHVMLQTAGQQPTYPLDLSNELTALRTNFFAPSTQLGAAPFMPQVPFSESDSFFGVSLEPSSKAYDLDEPQLDVNDAFLPQLDDLATSPKFEEATINAWRVGSNASSSLRDPSPSAVYGDGTINPSLLGGVQDVDLVHFSPPASPVLPSSSRLVAHSPSTWDIISRRSQSVRSHSHSRSPASSSSSSSSHSSTSPPLLSPSHSLSAIPRLSSSVSELNESEKVTSVLLRPSRPARRSFRHVPEGMIPTFEISSGDESERISTQIKLVKKSAAAKKTAPPPKQRRRVNDANDPEPGRKKRGADWPLCDEYAVCHQCRTSSYKVKLKCPCGKQYCLRCLSLKYVVTVALVCISLNPPLLIRYDGEFVYDPARITFTCPSCQKTCTCDICTRKRGGVYIGPRSHLKRVQKPLQSSVPLSRSDRVKTKPKKVPQLLTSSLPRTHARSSLGGKTNLPPFSTTIRGPETYWATMYAVSGEKIGRAFVGEDGNDDTVVVRRLQDGKRVFVGAVQPSWGLGPDPVLKDLDPIPEKHIANSSRKRHYVGNKAALYYRTAPKLTSRPTSPVSDGLGRADNGWVWSDGFASPLSSLGDDLLSGEGECRQWPALNESDLGMALQEGVDLFVAKGPGINFSPDSLGDTDVARAITLGLMACGHDIQVQL